MISEGNWGFKKYLIITSIIFAAIIIIGKLLLPTKQSVIIGVIGNKAGFGVFSGNPEHAIFVFICLIAYIAVLFLYKPIKSVVEKPSRSGRYDNGKRKINE